MTLIKYLENFGVKGVLMSRGIIYVCSTAVEGLIKIGRTNDFQKRMKFLEDNGYKNVTGLKRQFAIEVDNYEDIEQLLDDLFAKSRVGNSELFSLDLNKIIQLLSSFSGKQVYPTDETKQEVFNKATEIVYSKMIPEGEYFLSRKIKEINQTVKAQMVVENGKFILKKGSIIAPYKEYKTPSWITIRKSMKLDNNGILLKDVECSSPSMAAALVVGQSANGWTCWKNENNQSIDIYRRSDIDE